MSDAFFQPVSGMDLPRFAGVPTFMRLPLVGLDDARLKDVDIGIIGVPWDSGTTNRPGPRHGPRQLRDRRPCSQLPPDPGEKCTAVRRRPPAAGALAVAPVHVLGVHPPPRQLHALRRTAEQDARAICRQQ